MTNAEKIALLRELLEYDHGFITPEGVRHFTEPFGFAGSTFLAHDTRDNPKGLTLPGGEAMEGQDAAVVAEQIAHHLDADVPPAFGRGTRLRLAVNAAIKKLEKGVADENAA